MDRPPTEGLGRGAWIGRGSWIPPQNDEESSGRGAVVEGARDRCVNVRIEVGRRWISPCKRDGTGCMGVSASLVKTTLGRMICRDGGSRSRSLATQYWTRSVYDSLCLTLNLELTSPKVRAFKSHAQWCSRVRNSVIGGGRRVRVYDLIAVRLKCVCGGGQRKEGVVGRVLERVRGI